MSTGVMTDRVTEAWPRFYARIAGGLYLIVIVGGIFAEIFVRGRLVVGAVCVEALVRICAGGDQ